MASGATCVQRLDGSRDSAIHTKYRISLRSSSMQEPRYPLPRVVLFFERSVRQHHPKTGRGRAQTCSSVLGAICAGVRCSTSKRNKCPKGPCTSTREGKVEGKTTRPNPHVPRCIETSSRVSALQVST